MKRLFQLILAIIITMGLSWLKVSGQNRALRLLRPLDSTKAVIVNKPISRTADTSLIIRNSFESPDDKATPATASFTLPSGKASSFLIDAGVEYKIDNLKQEGDRITGNSFGPFAVFNRNTMIGQQQYMYKGGLQYQRTFGSGDDTKNSLNYVNFTFQYLKNQADTANSLLATIYYSYLYNNVSDPSKFFVNSYHAIGASPIFYDVTFNTGLEFQDVLQAGSSGTGFQGRLFGEGGISLAWRQHHPKQKTKVKYLWPKLLELNVDFMARYALINSGNAFGRYLPLFKPSLNYYPMYNDAFSIGLSYNNGSDPVAGIATQKFWQLAIQFQK